MSVVCDAEYNSRQKGTYLDFCHPHHLRVLFPWLLIVSLYIHNKTKLIFCETPCRTHVIIHHVISFLPSIPLELIRSVVLCLRAKISHFLAPQMFEALIWFRANELAAMCSRAQLTACFRKLDVRCKD
jgi:hypothetical protein